MWHLVAQILSILLLDTVVTNNKHVVAELSVIPLWNVTMNKTDSESCGLGIDNNLQDVVKFTGDAIKTCSVQLTSSNGTAALIRIPQGAFVYAERNENILNCQMKYLSLAADEPCFFVSRHPKLQLFLQGDGVNGSNINISQIPVNASAPICQDGTGSKGQHTSRVSQTNQCQAHEFDNLIFCNLSPDSTCSFKFPGSCNVTLGNREVKFQCLDNIVRSSHKALTIYPPGINTLDLARQSIVELKMNPFITLKSLKRLLLAYNDMVVLPWGLLSGLRDLEYLTLRGNRLSSLDGNLFNETKKLSDLILRNNNLKQLPNVLLYGLKQLNELHLGGNDLTVLPKGFFVGLKNLKYLYLWGNQINSLDEELFIETNKLTVLNLAGNNLSVLPKGLFMGMRNLETLSVSRNRINSLDEKLFNENNKLISLDLTENDLTVLPKGLFMEQENLEILYLYRNPIISLDEELFRDNNQLTELYIADNYLTFLPDGLFTGLRNLETLELSHNKVVDINKNWFRDLINLKYLYLQNSRYKALDFNLFQYTRNISFVNLSGNKLLTIPDISNLWQLFYLNVANNKMTSITDKTFSYLPKQTELIVSQHEICECYVSHDILCTAVEDRSPFLTCDRLLSDRVLVVVMWLIGLNALGGNIFVLCRRQETTNKNKTQNFLLRNLAMSDLLMGVYMLLIASADIYFGQYFPMQAETWRSGIACRIAGTISILSSEASVCFVTLISLDRYLNIRYPQSRNTLTNKSSVVVVSILWIFSLTLGIVPSSLAGNNDKFYANSHVCIGLPLTKLQEFNTQQSDWEMICSGDGKCYWKKPVKSERVGEVNGMIFASVLFLGFNFICYLAILACYVEIIRIVLKSSKRAGRNPELNEQVRLTSRVLAIVLTDFACWFPIIIIGILVQVGVLTLPPDVFAWCVTFVLPINSAINPYLYTIASVISKRRKQARGNGLQDSTHPSYRRRQAPEVSNTSDIELSVITK